MIFHLLSIVSKRPLIAGTAVLAEGELQEMAPVPASLAPDKEEQATLPHHKDASWQSVVHAMTTLQSCS